MGEHGLHRHEFRAEVVDDARDVLVKSSKSGGQRKIGRYSKDASLDDLRLSRGGDFDHAVAGDSQAGVDAKDPHGWFPRALARLQEAMPPAMSLEISPSVKRTIRWHRSATASSWVTMITVRPS